MIRPRAARIVAFAMAAFIAIGLVWLGVAAWLDYIHWGPVDHVFAAMVYGAGIWFVLRQANVSLKPDEQGIRVQNLIETRHVTWEEIVQVSFGHHRPWAYLDLSDGTTLSVMAIQSADGAYARDNARLLATWVQEREPQE